MANNITQILSSILLFLYLLEYNVCLSTSESDTTYWSRPVIIYTNSYAESHRAQSVAILTPQLVGNMVWTVQQRVEDGCPIYPMDILISSQHGTVPWLNESAWSPDLLILRRQRFDIRLDESVNGARVLLDTMGTRVFYFTAISLAPERSKVQKLGLTKQSCSYAVHFNPTGKVPISVPLLQLDTNVTVQLRVGQLQFFRLAVPQFAYSVQLEIVTCNRINADGTRVRLSLNSSDCQFFASVSAGAAADLREMQPLADYSTSARSKTRMLFADRLSPLSDANYLSLAINGKNLFSLTFSVRVHQHCRPPPPPPALSLRSDAVCELFPLSLQNYDIYGKMVVHPTSPSASGGMLRIRSAIPTVIPFTIRGLFDSVRYLLIDVAPKTGPISLDFCLGRQLSLGLDTLGESFCELKFELRSQADNQRRVMPHPPAGVWYLAITNRLAARAEILLIIRTMDCPAQCLNGGRCDVESLESLSIHVCRCYDGFAGDLCESRVPISPNPLASLLLLCLSNAAFLPTVALACRRGLLVEGLIYCMAMLSSGLYHACDNNYAHQLCIVPFDTLGKLDFLGAFLSLWVTLLLLVDLTPPLKQLVQTAGSLFLMIGVLINRTSFIIIAVPLGVGFLALIVSWSCRCYTNRRCYPPLRLVLTSLLPGGGLALAGFAMFALLDTRANYFLVHSGWHCCVAFAILLFLIPRDRLRFLPRRGASATDEIDSGDAGDGSRNCGVDRCFVLVNRGVRNSDERSGGGSGGISQDVEYSALPLVSATASSTRESVLGNGSQRRPPSAMSLSSSEEDEDVGPAEDVDEQQIAEVSRQLAGVHVGRRRSPGQQASVGDLSGAL